MSLVSLSLKYFNETHFVCGFFFLPAFCTLIYFQESWRDLYDHMLGEKTETSYKDDWFLFQNNI